MTAKKIRHLPVFDNDKLVGIVSVGDILKSVIDYQKYSIDQMEKYVSGRMY